MDNLKVDAYIKSRWGELTGTTHLTRPNPNGDARSVCPKCSATRNNNPKEKCLRVNVYTGHIKCHNPSCDVVGMISDKPAMSMQQERTYNKPKELKPTTSNIDIAINYLKGRGIDTNLYGLATGANMYFHQIGSKDNAVVFTYYYQGELINQKWRALSQKAWGAPIGCKNIPYNADAIDRANKDKSYLIITEGEIDALSWITAGYENTISTPNGTSSTAWLDDYIHLITDDIDVRIAYDNDTAGNEGFAKIQSRIPLAKKICYPEGMDANKCLTEGIDLEQLYENAESPRIKGLATVNDYRDTAFNYMTKGYPETQSFGISRDFDLAISFYQPELTVVTAAPNSGKSAFTEALCMNLATLYGKKTGFLTGEKTIDMHIKGMAHRYSKVDNKKLMDSDTAYNSITFLNDHFYYYNGDVVTIDEILTVAERMVRLHGISCFVIDNWSVLEETCNRGEDQNQMTSRLINKVQRWIKKNFCHIIIIAHPKKMEVDPDGYYKLIDGYGISGSAAWYNLPDNGLTLRRTENNGVDWRVWKIRNQEFVGKPSRGSLKYRDDLGGQYVDHEYESDFVTVAGIDNTRIDKPNYQMNDYDF